MASFTAILAVLAFLLLGWGAVVSRHDVVRTVAAAISAAIFFLGRPYLQPDDIPSWHAAVAGALCIAGFVIIIWMFRWNARKDKEEARQSERASTLSEETDEARPAEGTAEPPGETVYSLLHGGPRAHTHTGPADHGEPATEPAPVERERCSEGDAQDAAPAAGE